MKLTILLVIISVIQLSVAQNQKYCNKALCQGRPNIGCPGNAKSQCPSDASEILMTPKVKELILRLHNLDRNVVAGGRVPGLPSARAMPTMQWDSELAYLAHLNAMRCHFGHDQCHNTAHYHWSGQNIAWSIGLSTDETAIRQAIDGWWKEYRQAKKQDIEDYGTSHSKIGAFTAMSQDRTDRIGCGGVRYKGNNRIVVCNYSFTNMKGSYVYHTGKPTSGCKTGKNPKFANLCSTKERVNPNP